MIHRKIRKTSIFVMHVPILFVTSFSIGIEHQEMYYMYLHTLYMSTLKGNIADHSNIQHLNDHHDYVCAFLLFRD